MRRKRRMRFNRTAKSCGPDIPTLMSSWRDILAGDGDNKARSPGRARRKPLKPFAQGMPVRSGEPVVTTRMLSLLHTRLRVRLTCPAFPAPSVFNEGHDEAKPGQNMPREGEGVSGVLCRRPGQAKRDPGPITTGAYCSSAVCLRLGFTDRFRGMGPRVRGDDSARR